MRVLIWSNAFTRSFKKWIRKRPDQVNDIAEALTLLVEDPFVLQLFSAVILGIRRDEHGIRAKERHVHLLSIVGIKARWRGYRSLNKISSVERRIT